MSDHTFRYTGSGSAFVHSASGTRVERAGTVTVGGEYAAFFESHPYFEFVDTDTGDGLAELDYRDLQQRAKEMGVAANQSAEALREALTGADE